ncbi:MAG: TraB/GumN family protein [Bacteroidota bacterium]
MNTKLIFSLLLGLLGFVSFGYSQTPEVTAESYAPTKAENALLWQIEGKDLQQPSWLFGTIHMIDKEDFFLTEAAKASIGEAGRVTFEINMEDMNDLSAQFGLMMNAFMKDGKTLKDLLSETDYKLVNDHFQKIGLPMFMLERIKPMFLSVFASGDMDMSSLSSGSMVSYEMEIMKLAKEDDKEIGGLETAEYQMSMFDSIPYQAQAEMLVESIRAGDSGSDQFDQMVQLYKNQDLHGMSSMLSSDEEGIGEYEDLLLATRNKNWIPIMGEMMKTKPTFFAVGAGHLGGEMGVVAVLRKEGYKVTPINPSTPKP